jgi:pyridoxamine 5'-phosphate oxidase family protein
MTFTDAELDYLATQRLGRLATVAPDGYPHNKPVAFKVSSERGTIDIGGYRMGTTRKFANAVAHPQVCLVVDDIASVDPWVARGIEIRGDAETLTEADPPMPGFSPEVIRIHPRRILAWGLDPDRPYPPGRTIPRAAT